MRYDALVIGGGPSGSTTASRLAQAGLSVMLADKSHFPRDKPCGGGLTLRAVQACPVDVTPVVEARVAEFDLRFRGRSSRLRTMRQPVVWMTQRRRLDALLLEDARDHGVDVREGASVQLEVGRRHFVDGQAVRADVVVGADGANGISARRFELGGRLRLGVAFEGEVPYSAVDRSFPRDRALIDVGDVAGGYGWIFPKGDHLNVGIGAWASEGRRIKELWRAFCERHHLPHHAALNVRGHRLPLRSSATVISTERALLVGDAAGLIDPISGDGLYECFISAELATAAIVDLFDGRARSLAPYASAVDGRLAALHVAGMAAKRALDVAPWLSWRLASTRFVWRTIERLLDGELSSIEDAPKLHRIPFRVLEAAGAVGRS